MRFIFQQSHGLIAHSPEAETGATRCVEVKKAPIARGSSRATMTTTVVVFQADGYEFSID